MNTFPLFSENVLNFNLCFWLLWVSMESLLFLPHLVFWIQKFCVDFIFSSLVREQINRRILQSHFSLPKIIYSQSKFYIWSYFCYKKSLDYTQKHYKNSVIQLKAIFMYFYILNGSFLNPKTIQSISCLFHSI